jgi:hypothetical protein
LSSWCSIWVLTYCVFSTPDKAALLKLIDVLRTVTAGMLLVLGSSVVDSETDPDPGKNILDPEKNIPDPGSPGSEMNLK